MRARIEPSEGTLLPLRNPARGMSYERVYEFEFGSVVFLVSDRRDYGEIRRIAVGHLGNLLIAADAGIRVISFRKANLRVVKTYGHLFLTDDDGAVLDLTKADFEQAFPFSALPLDLQNTYKAIRRRGPQKDPTKVPTTTRFDSDVLTALKASGRGWQTRVNDAMREVLKINKPNT